MVRLVQYSERWRVSDDESRGVMSEGEGACSLLFKVRSHLPLRGKQGWMTPRVGVKTTPANWKRATRALVPKRGPTFLPTVVSNNRHSHFMAVCLETKTLPEPAALVNLLRRRDVQVMQYVDDFGVPQPRRVIFK